MNLSCREDESGNVIDEPQSSITVYPNPTSDKVLIISSETISENEIEFFDVTGKKYSIESISSVSPEGLAIDLSEFSSGLYFVRVHTSSEFELIKVIKQ